MEIPEPLVLTTPSQPSNSISEPPIEVEEGYNESPVAPRMTSSYSDCKVEGKFIALTFDDGPSPTTTPLLLDILKERRIRATFFVLGRSVAAHPDIVRRAADEGHEIANHSWDHPKFASSKTNLAKQLDDTNKAILSVTGKVPTVMRPPFGATSVALNKRIVEKFGMKVILWSVDPLDWKYRNSQRVARYIVEHTRTGGIILAHDIHKSTVDAMIKVCDELLAQGYQFVTVSELLAMNKP